MKTIDDLTRLKHIRDSAQEALLFVNNRTREELDCDRSTGRTTIKEYGCSKIRVIN